ncbi:MAG: hypothetical protein LUF04_06965 [Bacteroides sp.]|nr:hypothetical protein [Bacteroides sp.]
MSKSYRLLPEYILWEMSFANVNMYNAILPSYDTDKDSRETEVDFEDLESALLF